MKSVLLALALAVALPIHAQPAKPADAKKVLRYSIRVAETGFDPAQVTDLYSRTMAAGMFDAPLRYAFLQRPLQLEPSTTDGMPEVSADFKTITFKIRPGIYFTDDPVFKGQKRELTAADYVYSLKRHYDPRFKSGSLYILEQVGILGLSELRKELAAAKKPFDYDRPVEGLKALDRYTFQVRTREGNPRFLHQFADVLTGALAREVVEHYGDKIMEHPVGTGPWRLAEWRRSSLVAFEKNPNFREERYAETPPADADPQLRAQAAALQGKRLPLVDRVEISVIEENQPRWLSFLNKEADLMEELPPEFTSIGIPNNQLAPNLVKQGIRMVRYQRADITASYFAMENPVVGGYTPEKIALRRAIALAYDSGKEIRLVRRGQAAVAQGIVGPNTFGYDPAFKSEMGDFDLARAKALLDQYGYVDKNGDGWREQPDGSPLVLQYNSQPDSQNRQLIEQWQKNMDALGVRIRFTIAKWPENLKSSRAGKLMMWGVGWTASIPDAEDFLGLGYGPNKGQANHSRFDLPAYNKLYQQQLGLPDGPERQAVIKEMQRLMVAYMPYKVVAHRTYTDLAQPWLLGYSRNVFVREFWRYVDIDLAKHP